MELGLSNLSYMQADILNLKKLGKKFDIIESAGVLTSYERSTRRLGGTYRLP